MSNYYGGFPPYVSVAQKRAKAAKKLKELKKKNSRIQPVIIEGQSITNTWWGKSWNKNLERYADYGNRIGRGRSYVLHGAVLDLQINTGKIRALVQGSRSKPYEVEILIAALSKNNWQSIRKAVGGQLDSLAELLAGKFPQSLRELFFAREKGLFPSPQEIHFDCSCPDWASMCKHVAAALYGIGARLDEQPGLFFTLRQVEVDELITQTVQGATQTLLKKAGAKSSRVMEDVDLADVFGIELDGDIELEEVVPPSHSKQITRAKSAKKPKKRTKRTTGKLTAEKTARQKSSGTSATRKKTPGKAVTNFVEKSISRHETAAKPPPRRASVTATASTSATFVDAVITAIPRRRKKMSIADLCARVDLTERQVRNAVARAVAQGRLRKLDRGIFIKP